MSGEVHFTGTEVAVITALLSVLAGTVGALWLAYSRAMQQRLDALVADRDALRGIAFEAIELVLQVITVYDPPNDGGQAVRARAEGLRQRVLRAGERPVGR